MPRASARLRVGSLLVATAFAWALPAQIAAAQTAGGRTAGDQSPLVACVAPPSPIVTGLMTSDPAALPPPSTPLATAQPIIPPTHPPAAPRHSRRGLVPLFASYAVMQALDVHSTLAAIDRGGVEQNALMAPLVRRPAAFVALKAGMTAAAIVAANRIARNNRVAAYALMFALNSAYAYVVVHNYRVAAAGQ